MKQTKLFYSEKLKHWRLSSKHGLNTKQGSFQRQNSGQSGLITERVQECYETGRVQWRSSSPLGNQETKPSLSEECLNNLCSQKAQYRM